MAGFENLVISLPEHTQKNKEHLFFLSLHRPLNRRGRRTLRDGRWGPGLGHAERRHARAGLEY